jgi:hypothetical protein
MTAQTHTPDDPPGEKPIERWSRWENSKVPERRCTAHKRNREQCKTLQYAAATSTYHYGRAPAGRAEARLRLEMAADRNGLPTDHPAALRTGRLRGTETVRVVGEGLPAHLTAEGERLAVPGGPRCHVAGAQKQAPTGRHRVGIGQDCGVVPGSDASGRQCP